MIKDIGGLLECVTKDIRNRMDAAVIGLSGGADSTLVAILCRHALGKDNVYGLHLPYNKLDEDTFNARSAKLATHLGINNNSVNIGSAVDALTVSCNSNRAEGTISKLNQGNLRSRMRMVALYTTCCDIAERTGQRVRVIGTGNLSEDMIGYDTKGGDALADYFPIGSLAKSEVYQLLDYFRDQGIITEDMIDRVPSAGLWDGQTDEDELGYSYDEMEKYVVNLYNSTIRHKGAVEATDYSDPIWRFVYNRYINNKHKHEAPPVTDLRSFCEGETI